MRSRRRPLYPRFVVWLLGCWLSWLAVSAGTAEALDAAWDRLPAPVQHGPVPAPDTEADRYAALIREKLADRWFAALVSVEPESRNAILGRFATRRSFFDFLETQNPLVELWAYVAGGPGEDGLPGRRLTAEEVARLTEASPDTPTFVTVTWAEAEVSGKVRRARVEFGFAAADQALVRGLAYQRSRLLQQTARQILSARDESGRLSAEAQWRELEREKADGGFVLVAPEPLPASATNLYVAVEFTVDDASNLLRPVMVYRQNDIEREVLEGQIRLRLRQPGGGIVTARAFRRTPLGDELEPALSPISGRDFVELRLEDPLEPDPRRWNVLEFGEPDVLQQAALARFGLINAFLERRRKVLGLQRANLDMIFFPIFTALNIGGGLSGVGFPLGTGAQLGYNVITGPHFIPKVPTAQEMRELFRLLAARQRHPILRFKPDEVLTKADLETLRAELSQLTDEEVEETLESLNDGDLRAMLALARLAGNDAKYSLFVNILSGAAVVSGQADSGVLRDLFNNPYFALNGDVYVNYIIAAAVGQKVLTPAGGNSLYDLARGDGPAKAWAQYLGISFDIRALMNSVSRLRFRSLADKELRMPFPYAPRMNDLAAYEIHVFGYPVLLFYKRGLIRDDLKAYNEDYAYGLLGRTIVTHFPTRESMEAEIRAGRMVPLGYVKVSDGKGGLRDSNLAVFAYQMPDGPHRGRTAMIIYGLKAFADYSATVDREVTRFREYERGLAEGLVLDQMVEAEDADDLPATAFEPRVFTGERAIADHFVPVLAPLMEWRRLLRRQQLSLPREPGESEQREKLRRALAAVDVVVADSGEDPLLGIQAEGSSFRYVTRVNGHRRVRQLTAVAGLAAVERARQQLEESRQIAEWHRSAIAEGGSGVAFVNRVEWRNGRWEVGPLVRSANGSVDGAGVRRTAEQLESLWSAVDALPLRERVAAQERNFAGLILALDADGDGTPERVAVSFEFPVGEVRRKRTNPETGLAEVEVYANGRLRQVVTATSWLEISRDDQGRETESRLSVNTGTISEPRQGDVLEQTRTLERWTPGSVWDPYAAREGKLRLNRVTGQWTWEIYGVFNRPVESVDEQAITRSQFDEAGRWVSAVGWVNATPDEPGVLPPTAVLRPTPGERRYRETALGGTNGQRQVERVDEVTGVRRVLTFNSARWGRLEAEEFFDSLGAGTPIRKRTEAEYDERFYHGWIPRVSRTRAESGRLWSEVTTLSVDPISRHVTAEVRDETGAMRTQTWSARWDVPLRSETRSRVTEQQLAVDGLSLTGSIRARDSGEEVARLVGRFDRSSRQWVMEWEWWYRPGIRQRQETRYLSPGGQELRMVSGGMLETRMFRDAEGFVRSNQVWFAETPGGDFNRLVRAEDDWQWRDGGLNARVRTWVDGQPHDEFRILRDAEGRLARDGIRTWPSLQLETQLEYDGDSERVRRTEEIQNGQVRRVGRPLADQPGEGTERRLPIQFTPHWGLVTTQWMVLGDPLGRPRETLTEDGRQSVTVEWYPGTALARRTETRDRQGRLEEWTRWDRSERALRGIPLDRVRRSVPDASGAGAVPLGDRWLARGTDVAVASESAEGQVFHQLSEPGEFPEWTRDESGRSGVPVRLGGRWERNVVSVSRARILPAEPPGEPLLELQTVDLRPLFQPVRTVQRLDRSGKVLEARVSRIAAPASGELVAESLWNAPSIPGDQYLHRYEYAPVWRVVRSQGRTAGAYETWTAEPPRAGEAVVPVNVPPRRDVATSVESFLVLPEVSARPDGALRRVSRSEGRQLWGRNPYLRGETNVWTSWTTRVLTPAGKDLFTTEDIYDVQGQLSVRRIRKETLAGEPAVKWVYQLPAPRSEELRELTTSDGRWETVMVEDSGWIPSSANFLYFFTAATNAVEPVIQLHGFNGEKVTVGGSSGQSVAFWPISAAFTQWLPNEADPSQAATVTEPPTLPAGLRAYVINLAEVAQAGLEPATVNRVVLESSGPLRVTPLKTLEREGMLETPEESRRLVRQREDSPHDFHRITQVPLRRSAAAQYAGEDQQTVVERNGRPLAVTRPPLRRSPYPDVVVLATSDSGDPRPVYQVSSDDGHFLQFFEVVRQADAVQVYSVVEGFELPRFEVHRARVLGDEASPSLVAYGYDYHARVRLAKGAGWWGRPWAALRNRVAANPFSYAGERMLDRWLGTNNGSLVSRFNYGTLHHARVQSAAIQQLPSLAEGLLPTRTVPWADLPADQVALAPPVPIRWADVGIALRELHVSRFGTNLTRSLPGTYLIPTAPDTVAERYVETVGEAEIVALAVKVGEPGLARTLLEFYWDKTDGGLEPVQESYDALTGTARAKELAFSRPVQARPTSAAQVALAMAALDLADHTGETRWETLANNLVVGLLERFRPPPHGEIPQAVSDREYRSVSRVLGLAFWPVAARFPVEVNARTWQLLERMNQRRPLVPDPELTERLRIAAAEQRQWLTTVVEPEVRRTGVVPTGWFEVQDIYGETLSLAPERWTSPMAWLAWLEVAVPLGVEPATARQWLDHLIRVHGATVEGVWGLDWSLPLLRPEAISPELTARLARVAGMLEHGAAAALAQRSLAQWAEAGRFPAVQTRAAPIRPVKSEQGSVVYPRVDGAGWPRSFGVERELSATNSPLSANPAPARLRPDRDAETRPSRADLAVFLVLAGSFYLGILIVTLIWWRFRQLRCARLAGAELVSLVPEMVQQRAEERWSARVLGVQSPVEAGCTRFSNATVEQNFLMQLRAIYKLVLEWRRRENRWSEDDPRLVEGDGDAWLNGLDEFASVLGLYMRHVIKAGAKDGFDRDLPLAGNEDSNHIWSRLVMYLSEEYWVLLTLLQKYRELPGDQECALFEWEFAKALEVLGIRRRREPFDARVLFNFPRNPEAFDLLIIQKPGVTLEQVFKQAAERLQIPLSHLLRIVEGYQSWKRRESPYPIHPYLIEFAKIFPNFVLTGLGAMIWYNQSVGDSPIIPYLWPQAVSFVSSPAALWWEIPLFLGLVLAGVTAWVRTYRFSGGLLKRERPSLILDATMTSFFRRENREERGIRHGWRWNPAGYQQASWMLRSVGWTVLAWQMFQLETPSFANFLIVKGVLAMLVVTEVAGLVVPWVVTVFSKAVQDYVSSHPHCGTGWRLLNRLNFTATRPASPMWLSVRYYLRPSVPTGDVASRVQSILFYLVMNAVFFGVAAYLCQQILPLWFTEAYLTGSSIKLFVGGLVFWNTLYLLRYGLFLLATALAASAATFPLRTVAALVALGGLAAAVALPGGWLPEAVGWLVALVLIPLSIWEEALRVAWARWRGPAEKRETRPTTVQPEGNLGIVYMSGDDLSALKLTPALLLTRWRLLRDQLGSPGLKFLSELIGDWTEADLERYFGELAALEQRQAVSLWHPDQLVLAGVESRFDPALGLNLPVSSSEQRRALLLAWDVRRWLVSMMSTAGHSQDTAINLVDIALRLEREGLATRTVFYLIQNKYDAQDTNRPCQLKYGEGELGQRDKLARLLQAVAPGCRAWSLQNWTPFGFKSAGLTGMDLVPEETMRLGTMVVLDRNATVHDLDAFVVDLRSAFADPDLVIVIPGRGTTNTLTDLGQGSQLIEEGHRSFLRGVMAFLGGRASEGVGTGWGNIVTVTYGRVQRAMMCPATPKLPLTSRMLRGSSFAVRTEGLIGFTPHAVGISEDTWAVSQAAHNVAALGGRVRFAVSTAMWHKVRETWSHAEWLAAFPRWSGGYLQMMHDPLMQRINEFGPSSIFSKELRSNSGRNFLAAPFALLNALLLPLAIILDVTPFIQILMLLWNFGFVMNQVLTLHGLNTYLEGSGFHRLPAVLGALVVGLGAAAFPESRPYAPWLAIVGALYGGFLVGLNRWLVTRVRDVILFGPQLILHALGQFMRQSIEFVASGAAASDAQGVNMAFRSAAGPREDRPLDRFPHFLNLRTVIWIIGVPSLLLNLVALANLDMFNVLLLLPSLLFSVSAVAGPFLMAPRPGRTLGTAVIGPKLLGWLTALIFFGVVSLLVGRGGWGQTLGFGLFLGVFGVLTWRAGRYLGFHWRWRRRQRQLLSRLARLGIPEGERVRLRDELLSSAGDESKTGAILDRTLTDPAARESVAAWLRRSVGAWLREPGRLVEGRSRWTSEYQRAVVLALLVFLWFFVVPVPGLFVFTAGAYKTSMSLAAILTGLGAVLVLVLAGHGLGRWVQTLERSARGSARLEPRARVAYAELQRRMSEGNLSAEESSRVLALFTDFKTYLDQRSDAYAARTLGQVEKAVGKGS